MFVKGRTAIEGLSGSGSGFGSFLPEASAKGVNAHWPLYVLDLLLAPALESGSIFPDTAR